VRPITLFRVIRRAATIAFEVTEMRGRLVSRGVWGLAVCVVAALATAPFAGAGPRDDTQALQAKLDAGGNVFLPKLPDGQCYLTRGLWVTRDDTTIASDGACIMALGQGEGRIKRADGSLVRATAVFYRPLGRAAAAAGPRQRQRTAHHRPAGEADEWDRRPRP
jgi:hypothetical protein